MRILYINHYAGSPRHGMEYRPHYLARHWVRMGHQVTIVAASASHIRYNEPELTGDATEETIDEIRYVWLRTPSYLGSGVRRVINMAAFVLGLFRLKRRLLERFSPEVVIASSTYTWDIFPAHAIARRAGAKLVFEVHDLWPLTPMELGRMSKWHPFIASLQWGENYACRHADVVISMLPLADKHLSCHGMAPEKFHYIPNGIELSEWHAQNKALPHAHAELLEKLREQGRFILCYAGTHGLSDALDTLLEAASLMSNEPVDFVLVGRGAYKDRLRLQAEHMGLKNVHFLDPVSKEMIPGLLQRTDVLFFGGRRQPLYRFGISPNKLMDYMAAGKPIINSIEAGNDPVREAGCGITVKPDDPRAIADAVLWLMAIPVSERERMGNAGRTYVRSNHDYEVLARKVLRVLSSARMVDEQEIAAAEMKAR
jgi:glycosyltransferase involved in cell wall biosynthesis